MKTEFNVLSFVQGMTYDVTGEFNDLEKEIEMKDKNGIRKQYNHCSSLLTGIKYALDYIEDEEMRNDLKKSVDEMREILKSYRYECAKIIEGEQETL